MLTLGYSRARGAAERRAAVTRPVTFLRLILRAEQDMSARRILVVDDNDDVRYILLLLLERSGGYETLEAATGQEAVEKAISGRPDLILMDIRLPDISGVDATKAIKNNPRTERIPIVAYSALPLVGWKQQAFQAGMVAYLQKPVNLKLLMETIQEFIPS
jgi:CheY-like chemotaxis protein